MNWKNHLIFGIIVSILFIIGMNIAFNWYDIFKFPLNILFIAEMIIIILISPLVPDLDHENSRLHQLTLGFGLILFVLGLILYGLNDWGWIKTSAWLALKFHATRSCACGTLALSCAQSINLLAQNACQPIADSPLNIA